MCRRRHRIPAYTLRHLPLFWPELASVLADAAGKTLAQGMSAEKFLLLKPFIGGEDYHDLRGKMRDRHDSWFPDV